jgi:hypothetical protein
MDKSAVATGAFIAAGGVGLWSALAPKPHDLIHRDINDDDEAEAIRDTEIIVGVTVAATGLIAAYAHKSAWPFILAVGVVALLALIYELMYRIELTTKDNDDD